jgi:hypothetical protein
MIEIIILREKIQVPLTLFISTPAFRTTGRTAKQKRAGIHQCPALFIWVYEFADIRTCL